MFSDGLQWPCERVAWATQPPKVENSRTREDHCLKPFVIQAWWLKCDIWIQHKGGRENKDSKKLSFNAHIHDMAYMNPQAHIIHNKKKPLQFITSVCIYAVLSVDGGYVNEMHEGLWTHTFTCLGYKRMSWDWVSHWTSTKAPHFHLARRASQGTPGIQI